MVKKELLKFRDRLLSQEGATATEYAIMLALIIIVAFTTIATLGGKVDNSFTEAVTKLEEQSE